MMDPAKKAIQETLQHSETIITEAGFSRDIVNQKKIDYLSKLINNLFEHSRISDQRI